MTGRSTIAHYRVALIVAIGATLAVNLARADEPLVLPTPEGLAYESPSSTAYPNGTFGQQLAAASQGGGGTVGGPKHRPGSGRRDDWKVGPKWRFTVDGVLLYRANANVDAILAEVEPLPPSTELPDLEFRDNFDHAAGARMLLSSEFPHFAGYELQVGYLGVEKWLANSYFEQETLFAADLPLSDADVEQRRAVGYESALHSLEINFQRMTRGYLKPYAGVRYFGLDETISDRNVQFSNVFLGNPVEVGDTLTTVTEQSRRAAEIENNLIGFQGGLRLDMWRPTRRLHFNGFVSAGVFCNIVDRNSLFEESTSIVTSERVEVPATSTDPDTTRVDRTTNQLTTRSVTSADGTRIALVTEAALAATYRINSATALRAGYQVLYMDGVELAENLWTSPPPNTAIKEELFLHGWFAGFEYRR